MKKPNLIWQQITNIIANNVEWLITLAVTRSHMQSNENENIRNSGIMKLAKTL